MLSRDLLGEDGPFTDLLDGYAPRPAQIELSENIEQAIESGQPLIAEAGTGTGKTLAYLVPALASGQRVLFSTGTKTLQDQLFFRDLPLVRKAIGSDAQVALLKGRANYLCLYRMHETRESGRLDSRASVANLEAINQWSGRTEDGDLSTSDLLPDDSLLWPLVTSSVDNCLGSECPLYSDCFVVKARRIAQEADLVVVNHHLLFADMALKQSGFGEVLPGADLVVLDEAHLVPEIATRFFSQSLTSRQVQDLLRDVLAESGKISGGLALFRPLVEQGRQLLREMLEQAHDRLPQRGSWTQLSAKQSVTAGLQTLVDGIKELAGSLDAVSESSAGLDACGKRAAALVSTWQQFNEDAGDNDVLWFERRGRGLLLYSTPLDVAEPMTQYRAGLDANWIFTSATLSVRGRFDHFSQALGLEDADTFMAEGVFDYQNNALIWIPRDLPEPRDPTFTTTLMATVLPLLEANQGRAFLLFTSHRALQEAAGWLAERTEFPLFVQGQGARSKLLEDFRISGNGILLGAASFWEGVDVIGPALSLVVIDKLPFAAPDDPVLEARIRALKGQGRNAFQSLQLPQAVIALKQGAGRLIRDINDWGLLVLGDNRLLSKSYGRVFLDSLPPMHKTLDMDDALEFLNR